MVVEDFFVIDFVIVFIVFLCWKLLSFVKILIVFKKKIFLFIIVVKFVFI